MNFEDNGPWGIVADDLTGACDAGVQFAQRGLRTIVWLDAEDAEIEAADVTVVTTNSRRDTAETAAVKARHACRALHAAGARVLYKKIDSTLLGNLGPEIETVRIEGGFPLAFVTPAFPEMGRTVMNGLLHVRDSDATVDVAKRLREQGLETLVQRAPSQLGGLREEAGTTVVLDAISRADLAAIARAACGMRPRPLLAGSAGLAAELAACLTGRATDSGVTCVPNLEADRRRIALIVGSTNPVTVRQTEYVEVHRRGRYPIMRISMEQSPSRVADLSAILKDARGIVLTGGDTALMVCGLLEARGIRLEREILPGIPWGRLIGGSAGGTAVATKAGGFGEIDALVRVADFLAATE